MLRITHNSQNHRDYDRFRELASEIFSLTEAMGTKRSRKIYSHTQKRPPFR